MYGTSKREIQSHVVSFIASMSTSYLCLYQRQEPFNLFEVMKSIVIIEKNGRLSLYFCN
jgi:hypothetical protein